MEREGMEGNNLLHFLDTPSAHYRRYAFFSLLICMQFSYGVVTRDLQFDVFASLSIEGHAMDLKLMEMITPMHQVCLSLMSSFLPFCILECYV